MCVSHPVLPKYQSPRVCRLSETLPTPQSPCAPFLWGSRFLLRTLSSRPFRGRVWLPTSRTPRGHPRSHSTGRGRPWGPGPTATDRRVSSPGPSSKVWGRRSLVPGKRQESCSRPGLGRISFLTVHAVSPGGSCPLVHRSLCDFGVDLFTGWSSFTGFKKYSPLSVYPEIFSEPRRLGLRAAGRFRGATRATSPRRHLPLHLRRILRGTSDLWDLRRPELETCVQSTKNVSRSLPLPRDEDPPDLTRVSTDHHRGWVLGRPMGGVLQGREPGRSLGGAGDESQGPR